MTFIDIKGSTDSLDDVLVTCMQSGLFQPEYASKLSEYSIGAAPLLRNPYGGLLVKIGEIASQLKIALEYADFSDLGSLGVDRDAFLQETNEYLNELRTEYPGYFDKQRKLGTEITSYGEALEMLAHLNSPDLDYDKMWANKFLKFRFGRMPTANLVALKEQAKDLPYELYELESGPATTWLLYMTAEQYKDEVDVVFCGNKFERLRVPDFVHGTAGDAMAFIKEHLEQERGQLEQAEKDLQGFVTRERDHFLRIYSKVQFLHDSYDLRKYAVTIHDQFHVIGFVLRSQADAFVQLFSGLEGINITSEPARDDSRIPPPVQLRNNWFVRPFEMFVNMYGSPAYCDIDPTPFVAYTYSVLFGIMFGDMGHGLCVALLGVALWKLKGMVLGRIMSRIGVVSMFFGLAYGSIFGFEHLLDPLFNAMGFHEKPIEIMHPDTTNKILIVAVGIGVAVILSVIVFNMAMGVRRRDWERVFLSHNGLCGFVLYSSVLAGALLTLQGYDVIRPPFILLFVALPLLLIFLREPITRYARFLSKDAIIASDEDLVESKVFQSGTNIPELFTSQYMVARFGRIPTDSYRKLAFYENEPFMLHPIKTDSEYIWLIYLTSIPSKDEIDAIFQDLYFERVYIPAEEMESNEAAEAFIRKCIDVGGTPEEVKPHEKYGSVRIAKHKTVYDHLFPDGFGAFFIETFFEMFEVILSFISNTMSFLRVGGFILIHAGMMSVVFTLAEMIGSGASVLVIVGGNIFVMALEGLIVGIQVLRLEFYEMFSRFFDAGGDIFQPAQVRYGPSSLST